ncbi:nucleoside hydrolase [Bacillus sp. CHD6a]|uniref:nucleoside hydrolase n=1 Tax=Bacillus sp. CHD6a TaxID=1643452 RepID=UPI0006CC1ECA|nr:nucleoside hydrolase [Bacillus sp. CHD6a]KPB03983.1 nucleoside hydrolase [Bacillus sp. CHD6a]
MPQKVLLYCDPGIDDSLAIIYALLNPEIDLVGVVTSYGNVDQEQATQNVAYLLELGGRKDIVLIGGAKTPLSGEFASYYPEIHGEDGLGPINPPATIKGELLNFDAIFQLIEEYGDELIIVDVGRSTSLAISFNLAGADTMNSIKGYYVMGGAFLIPGNVTAGAEANFYGDPIAAGIVMEKVKNGVLYPLNVTKDAIITPTMINEIIKQQNNPYQNLIKDIFDYYFKAYQKLVPGIDGSPLHDVMTLFAVTTPQAFKYVEKVVTVGLNEGNLRGVSIADFRPKPDEKGNKVTVALEVNTNNFAENFVEIMSSSIPDNNQ